MQPIEVFLIKVLFRISRRLNWASYSVSRLSHKIEDKAITRIADARGYKKGDFIEFKRNVGSRPIRVLTYHGEIMNISAGFMPGSLHLRIRSGRNPINIEVLPNGKISGLYFDVQKIDRLPEVRKRGKKKATTIIAFYVSQPDPMPRPEPDVSRKILIP